MARGDVVTDLNSVASTTWDYQPAAGVEVMVRNAHTEGISSVLIQSYDGTLTGTFAGGSSPYRSYTRWPITNTVYLRLTTSSTVNVGFSGLVTKA